MISSDAYFIGTPQHPCQDYALAARVQLQDRELACAVLADGCSSSPHSDVGARILSFSMLKALRLAFGDERLGPRGLTDVVLQSADLARNATGLPLQCLDATLIGLATDGESLVISGWGDGLICLPGRQVELIYPSGAPYYLSYQLDPNRCQQYQHEFPGLLEILDSERREVDVTTSPSFFERIEISPDTDVTVTAFSDGISAFRKEDALIDPAEVLPEFTGFKTVHGQYVRRRFKRAMRECERLGWRPFDDLACASVSVIRNQANQKSESPSSASGTRNSR